MKIYRCASMHFAREAGSADERMAAFEEWMALALQALDEGARILCCPESFLHIGIPRGEWSAHAEVRDGVLWRKLADLSRTYQCLVFSSLLIKTPKGLQNAAVLFDHGVHHVFPKSHPTIDEKAEGVVAGQPLQVATTSIGRVAAITCFDLNFPELHIALAAQRPDLVMFPTMFRGGLRLRALALQVSSYVLSCNVSESCLVNPLGRVLHQWGLREESAGKFAPWSITDINLDYGVFHYDGNAAAAGQVGKLFPGKFRFEHAQAEGVFMIESVSAMSVRELERHLNLVRVLDYFDALR